MPPTPDEEATIEEVLREQEAEHVNGWVRRDPGDVPVDVTGEPLVAWEDQAGEIGVVVARDESDDGVEYTARAEAIDDDVRFSTSHPARWEESLETAMDDTIQWLRRHRPGVPMPTFSMRIEGGVLKPLIELLDRLGGRKTLIEVRDTGVVFESASPFNAIDFRIPLSDMEEFDVDREGELTVDTSFIWDALRPRNFGDIIPVSTDAGGDPPRLQVADQNTIVRQAVEFNRRSIPEPSPFDARFTVDGMEFRDKIRAARIIESEAAVFGARDGVAFLRIEDDETGEEFTARIETTEIEGEQVLLINPERLQQIRRAAPRPSKTPLTFTLKGDAPLLVEYTVGETDVDVRIATRTGAVPREVEVPPAEITVPEGADGDTMSDDEPTGREAGEDALDEIASAAATEVEGATTPPRDPSPPPEDDLEEQRGTIVVTLLGGSNNYVVKGSPPGAVEDDAISAAIDTLGQPGQFDVDDEVGVVAWRGTEITDIGFNPGRALLTADDGADDGEQEGDDGGDDGTAGTFANRSRGEIETIVEESTLGIESTAQIIGSQLREIKLRRRDDPPVEFTTGAETITVTARNSEDATILAAIERWSEFANPDSLTAGQRDDINERREALSGQFSIDIPPYLPDVEPPEEEPEDVGLRFSADEIRAIVERATGGVVPEVRVNADANSLRIGLEPIEATSIRFVDDPQERQGAATDPVPVINEAIAEWQNSVDLTSVPHDDVIRRRERVEDEFGIDLLELGDEPPEPSVEAGEDATPALEGIWADVHDIAIDQSIPLEDRELRVGERLEPLLFDEYPDEFTDLFISLDFPPGGTPSGKSVAEVLKIELGGIPSPAGEDRFAMPSVVTKLSAVGPVSDPQSVWEDLLTILEIFDTQSSEWAEVTEALEAITTLSTFRIESGRFDVDDIIMHPDEIRPIASRNADLWVGILTHMKDQSEPWWAAQRITECAEGIERVCETIEQEIAGTNRRGYASWYLENAYEIYLDGEFDAKRFIEEWHDVFRPGETEAEALDRRGPVNLDTLGRPGGGRQTEAGEQEAQPRDTGGEAAATVTPEEAAADVFGADDDDEPQPTPGVPDVPEGDDEDDDTDDDGIADFRDDILGRMENG